jgi:hypothetical protein
LVEWLAQNVEQRRPGGFKSRQLEAGSDLVPVAARRTGDAVMAHCSRGQVSERVERVPPSRYGFHKSFERNDQLSGQLREFVDVIHGSQRHTMGPELSRISYGRPMDVCPEDQTMLSGRTVLDAVTLAPVDLAWCWRCKRAWLHDDGAEGSIDDFSGTWGRL